jgi:hypothetical protein
MEAFCWVFLGGFVYDAAAGQPAAKAGAAEVPAWFSEGLAQNLYSTLRARDHETMLELWSKREAPTLSAVLTASPSNEVTAASRAVDAVVFSWLASRPNGVDMVEKILQGLARGESITPAWFCAQLGNCNSVADLEAMWDDWLLRQRSMVYAFGSITPELLERFREELHVRRPADADPGGGTAEILNLRELIERRGEPWVTHAVWATLAELRRHGLGRPEAFRATVDAYCVFLEDVVKGRSAKRLTQQLDKADERLTQLEQKVAGAAP